MSIGQVIKVVREERGLTQSQFAHELFVTQPDGTRSGDYCNCCYGDGVFLQDYANSDELVAACAPMMAESCHISVEQAEDCMSTLLPNLKRWRRQDEIDAVAEGE